jgi:hypothetical protein
VSIKKEYDSFDRLSSGLAQLVFHSPARALGLILALSQCMLIPETLRMQAQVKR